MSNRLQYNSEVEACFKKNLKAGQIVSVMVVKGRRCQEMTFPITTPVPDIKVAISNKFVEWLGEEKKSVNGNGRKLLFRNTPRNFGALAMAH